MTSNHPDATPADILDAARQLGLGEAGAAAATAELVGADADTTPPRRGLHSHLSDDERTGTEALRDLLAASDIGIDSDAKYWNDMPEYQISETLSQYGFDVEFDHGDDGISVLLDDADTELRIRVTDRQSGLAASTEFEYPDTRLDTNNYPALVHAINTRVLDAFDLEYVQMHTDGSRWRFLLVPSDRLAALKRTYGPRLRFLGGEPLLSSAAPEDYLADPIPTEHGNVPTSTTDADVGDALLADDPDGVDPVTASPEPATPAESPSEMTGGVLDFEAINDATAAQEGGASLDLDEEVESVIAEAEEMIEAENDDEEEFEGETAAEPDVASELEATDETTSEGDETDDEADEQGILDRARSRLDSLFGGSED